MDKILTIKNLEKNFYTIEGEINAINDISFDVYNEEFLSIVGSSGCGKSTLLNIISGLDFPTSGDIIYDNEKPIIGYMLQIDALLPWLSILDNCLLGLRILNKKNDKSIAYTKKLLKTYGLEEFMDKYPDQLSGGMKQRVV